MQFAPYPPSPDEIDQHAVVTLTMRCAPVTLLGIICHVGVEPNDAAPRATNEACFHAIQLSQLAGLCSPPSPSDYQLHRLLD